MVQEKFLKGVLNLSERQQIPVLWSFSNKPAMTIDQLIEASTRSGIAISPSWSPMKGGNFRNRLVKEDRMFVEEGKIGKMPKYKLSASGRMKVAWILEQIESKKAKKK